MDTEQTRQNPPHVDERGQDAVEFALIIPILFLIVIVVLDFGRISYYNAVLHNAAREGARYGSIDPTDIAGIEAAVENLAIGIAPADLVITITDDPAAKVVEVAVSYDMPIVFPLVRAVLGGITTAHLSSQATLAYEQ
jgi:Flp pilus assembly protein TadG